MPEHPAGAHAGAQPSADRAALRDRIAETLALRENGPASDGRDWFRDEEQRQSFLAAADAVLAVLPDHADRNAELLEQARDFIETIDALATTWQRTGMSEPTQTAGRHLAAVLHEHGYSATEDDQSAVARPDDTTGATP